MKSTRLYLLIILCFVIFSGCSNADSAPEHVVPTSEIQLEPSFEEDDPSLARSLLTFDDLMTGFAYTSPLDEAALTMPENALKPEHTFEGHLELLGEETVGELKVLLGDPNQEPEVSHLPEFDFEFVQRDGYLIPALRGLIITEHPYWNYFIEPGRVWQEEGDQDYSRASFPFALNWKGANAVFNGTMSFLFNDEGVSKVWYQVTQETAIGLSGDMWGLLDASYHPGPVEDAEDIKAAFEQELSDRFPTKPIESLADDYPEVDVTVFGRGVNPRHMTWYGFVIDGVNYLGGCQTRYGRYPYCEYLRAPSYSTAKSAFASVALMRLAQKYDPMVQGFLIKDYVPEAQDSQGDWSQVTFDHALDMATGNYRSYGFMVDEEQWDNAFWSEDHYVERIAAAFDWPNGGSPGTQWVYRSSDTFIVTRAMHNYLQSVAGPEADIFVFVVEDVYKPLHMGPGVFSTQRTKEDNWNGQPIGLGGMWWVPDDLAKISTFLNVENGVIDGNQILHPDILAAALQRDPDDRGVDIDSARRKYNNAFWATKYIPADGYACEFYATQMLGYSGIVVLLMPNGTSYYYASDNRDFTWDDVIKEADKLIPHCSE
jgi:hypothetical protein